MKRGTGVSVCLAALLLAPGVAAASDHWRPYRGQLRAEIRREIREAMRDARRARYLAGRDIRLARARDRQDALRAVREAQREARQGAREARRAAREARRSWWY